TGQWGSPAPSPPSERRPAPAATAPTRGGCGGNGRSPASSASRATPELRLSGRASCSILRGGLEGAARREGESASHQRQKVSVTSTPIVRGGAYQPMKPRAAAVPPPLT